jgi:hypothetical protein
MLYLLLAVALCLLVPWLPVLMYRRLPRRPPPPLADWQLRQLAAEIRPEEVEEVGPTTTDITRGAAAVPGGRGESAGRAGGEQGPPPPTESGTAAPDRPAAARRLSMGPYRWVNILMVPVFPVAFLALAAAWAVPFHYLGEARARSFGPAVFLFKPFSYGLICVLPAIFLGIFSSFPPLMLLARLLMGRRRFTEYLFWDEGRLAAGRGITPDGVIRLLSHLALLVGALSVIYVCLVMNWYARFTEDEIAIKRLLAVREEAHPYGSVEQLVLTTHMKQNNEVVERENVHIRFADGKTWDTDATFFLPAEGPERERFLDFLRAKTGKPILRARFIKDVAGW